MNVRTWREQNKLTLKTVAERLSAHVGEPVSFHTVHRIEQGQLPSRELARAYLAISDGQVTPNDFYDLPTAPPEQGAVA